MASPTLTVANVSVNQGTTYVFLAGDFTGADGDNNFDHYEVGVLPTHGQLCKAGVPVAVGATFTEADLTAGAMTYVNYGLAGEEDEVTTLAVDALDAKSAPAATTITVVDGSWLLTLVSDGLPPVATRFSRYDVARAQGNRLMTSVGGVATIAFLPAAVVSGLPLNYFHGLDLVAANLPPLSARHTDEINRQASKLLRILNYSENADLKALVNTWGSALELEPTGRATLNESAKARWRNIRMEVEMVPATFQREFPLQAWWSVLTATAALI